MKVLLYKVHLLNRQLLVTDSFQHPDGIGELKGLRLQVCFYCERGNDVRRLSFEVKNHPNLEEHLERLFCAVSALEDAMPDQPTHPGGPSGDSDTPQGLLLVDIGALVRRAMATHRPPTPTGDGGDDGYDDAFRHVTQMAEEQGPPSCS